MGKRYEEYIAELTELTGTEVTLVVDPNDVNLAGVPKTKRVLSSNWGKAIPSVDIKTKYESNADTNAYTDAEKTIVSNSDTHISNTTNPHSVTKTQLSLENVDNVQQIPLSQKGSASGVAELDGSGKVPLTQIPSSIQGGVKVIGSWNADTNTPDLSSLTPNEGEGYIVSVAGSTDLNGETNWKVRDIASWLDSQWVKLDNTDDVISVAGKVGAVTLTSTDVGLSNLTNDAQLKRSGNDFSSGISQKAVPVSADRVLAEDSADSFNKVWIDLSTLLGGGGGGYTIVSRDIAGVSVVGDNQRRFMVDDSFTLATIFIKLLNAPIGASYIVDITKNGVSIFATTTANRPTISSGGLSATSGVPDTTSFIKGDIIGISILQVGTTSKGANLFVGFNS